MFIENIEKYSEISFVQENKAQSKAALQSCLYNLNNLKKFIEINEIQNKSQQHHLNNFVDKQNYRASLSNLKLPQISIDNSKNNSILNNFHKNVTDFSRNQKTTKLSLNNTQNYNILNFAKHNQNFSGKRLRFQQFKNKYIINILNQNKTITQNELNSSQEKKMVQTLKYASLRKKKTFTPFPTLAKNQKYFQESQVKVSQEIVKKLGLYEASNLYKKSNIQKFLKQCYQNNFKPIINLKFAKFSLCNHNQFFLTQNCHMPQLNQGDNLQKQIRKQKKNEKYQQEHALFQEQNIRKSYDKIIQAQNNQKLSKGNNKQSTIKQIQQIITIQNYQVIKNQQFYKFKKKNIEDWDQLKFILNGICTYLYQVKISIISFKFQKKLFMKQLWSCRRISQKTLQKLLKIKLTIKSQQKQQIKSLRLYNNRAAVIKQLATMWRDRQFLQKMKKQKQKNMQRLIWIGSRIIAKHKIRSEKKKRIAWVQLLNQKLRDGDWDYQIQIHIPSFSESQFVRNTTQYMQHYQNMFYHMWKSTNKQFILILPAINEVLLKILEQKIKANKNITLICPDSHQLYPKSLSLSACLLYSKDALQKIKKLIYGRKAIIIPGRKTYNKFLYEEHLSYLLNCPLFTKLNVSNLIGQNKKIWQDYQIPITTFTTISQKSTIKTVIQKFSHLICQHPNTKLWLFKINQQFNGRGIAKFDVGSSKKLKQIISLFQINKVKLQQKNGFKEKQKFQDQIEMFIVQYLQNHFRLRLKVNFQNCIFRVQEYINMFLEKGGIIQEYVQDFQTFQLCYKLQPGYSNYSHLYILDQIQEKYICCTQNYEIDFVTKASIFLNHQSTPKIIRDFSKRAEKVLKSEKYLGYVSITVIFSQKSQQVFAIQIKSYMTLNSSMGYYLKMFSSRKANQINATTKLENLSHATAIQSKAEIQQKINSGLLFLFIPCIIFTDVDQATRSEFIQDLVVESWEKVYIKQFSHGVVSQIPDAFNGTIYLSLGIALSMLIYGKSFDLKKMKNIAVQNSRELSDRIQAIKLYRGKEQTRDFFQFGDLIRAITKIK